MENFKFNLSYVPIGDSDKQEYNGEFDLFDDNHLEGVLHIEPILVYRGLGTNGQP